MTTLADVVKPKVGDLSADEVRSLLGRPGPGPVRWQVSPGGEVQHFFAQLAAERGLSLPRVLEDAARAMGWVPSHEIAAHVSMIRNARGPSAATTAVLSTSFVGQQALAEPGYAGSREVWLAHEARTVLGELGINRADAERIVAAMDLASTPPDPRDLAADRQHQMAAEMARDRILATGVLMLRGDADADIETHVRNNGVAPDQVHAYVAEIERLATAGEVPTYGVVPGALA